MKKFIRSEVTAFSSMAILALMLAGLAPALAAAADTSAPTVPTNLSASTTNTQVMLSWTASTDDTGVTGYLVFRNGSLVSTVGATSYTDSSLSPNTAYTYTVEARDAAGNISAPATIVATTSADTSAPSVPNNLGATAVSSSQINLAWNASTDNFGVTGYDVYRNGSQIATTSGTSYNDSGLSANTSYTYNVAAFDAAGNLSGKSASANATTLGVNSTSTATSTHVTPNVPPVVQIDARGNIVVRGLTVTSVGSGSFSGTVWGLTYTVNYSGDVLFLLNNGRRATIDPSQIQVGDIVGVQGTITSGSPTAISAQVVRDYSLRLTRRPNPVPPMPYGNGTSTWSFLQQLLNRFHGPMLPFLR